MRVKAFFFFGINLERCLRNLIQCLYLSLDLQGFFTYELYIQFIDMSFDIACSLRLDLQVYRN